MADGYEYISRGLETIRQSKESERRDKLQRDILNQREAQAKASADLKKEQLEQQSAGKQTIVGWNPVMGNGFKITLPANKAKDFSDSFQKQWGVPFQPAYEADEDLGNGVKLQGFYTQPQIDEMKKRAPNMDFTFEEDPVTGHRFARLGKSVQKSGVNPEKAPMGQSDKLSMQHAYRELEAINKLLRTKTTSAGIPLDAKSLRQLQEQGMALEKQISGMQPGKGPISAPQMGLQPQAPAAPQARPPAGPTATNPKTGEKIQFINGQWQPVR
jgi:hypothetical protein